MLKNTGETDNTFFSFKWNVGFASLGFETLDLKASGQASFKNQKLFFLEVRA